MQCIEKESVSVQLIAGIGNTFFQFAAAYTHARYNNLPLYLVPDRQNVVSFLMRGKYTTATLQEIAHHHETPSTGESPYFLNYSEDLLHEKSISYKGNFFSEKWFERYKDEVVNLLSCPKIIKKRIKRKYALLMQKTVTVGIHIRTWSPDIIIANLDTKKGSVWAHLVPTREYLKNAIDEFPKDATFIVCSDNITEARDLLKDIDRDIHFINDCNGLPMKKITHRNQMTAMEDLYLLSFCDHNIITAGTFGWWAAYLNKNPKKKVICPEWTVVNKKRIKEDQYPNGWITKKMKYYK